MASNLPRVSTQSLLFALMETRNTFRLEKLDQEKLMLLPAGLWPEPTYIVGAGWGGGGETTLHCLVSSAAVFCHPGCLLLRSAGCGLHTWFIASTQVVHVALCYLHHSRVCHHD